MEPLQPEPESSAGTSNEICVRLSDGSWILLPPSLDAHTTYIVLEQEKWFEKEVGFVSHWLRPGMTAIDIGANLGIYSIPMARLVGPTGRVFAYEPTADTFARLARNRNLNGLDNLSVFQSAMSDFTGTACLSHGGSNELNHLSDDDVGERVRVTCLDDEAKDRDWDSPDFLKIDAEGKEDAILRGGAAFLTRHSPLIMFEINNGSLANTTSLHTLKSLGYNLFRLLGGASVLVPLDAGLLDPYELNLFAAKPDRAALMAEQGCLVEVVPEWTPDDQARGQALMPLRQLPCASVIPGLETDRDSLDSDYLDCLAAFSVWRSLHMPLPVRCAALDFAWRGLFALNQQTATLPRLLSLGRVAWEAGQRAISVRAFRHFLAGTGGGHFDINEPFWPASDRFDAFLPGASAKDWIIGSVAEQIEISVHFSSLYGGTTPELEWLHERGLMSNEMQRRRALALARAGQHSGIQQRLRLPGQGISLDLLLSGGVLTVPRAALEPETV